MEAHHKITMAGYPKGMNKSMTAKKKSGERMKKVLRVWVRLLKKYSMCHTIRTLKPYMYYSVNKALSIMLILLTRPINVLGSNPLVNESVIIKYALICSNDTFVSTILLSLTSTSNTSVYPPLSTYHF
jgi:hypothetical protein